MPGGRPERQQDGAADGGADQHGEVARHRVQPHRALQIRRSDDVVQQHLVRRLPQHAGAAVDHQDNHRLPHLQGAGDKEIAPAQRSDDEQRHADLDQAARVEAVRERAGGDREQQERQPVRHDGKAGQGRRMKFLVHHPVADDVLDIVRHHREHKGRELGTEARVAHRRKGSLGGWRRAGGDRPHFIHEEPSIHGDSAGVPKRGIRQREARQGSGKPNGMRICLNWHAALHGRTAPSVRHPWYGAPRRHAESLSFSLNAVSIRNNY